MRLAKLHPDDMTAEQRALHHRFTSGPRAAPDAAFPLVDADGRLDGPPNGWLLSPRLGSALEQLGGAIRFGLRLSPRAAEIAVLSVAHHRDSPFEVHAHVRAGRAAGLRDADLAALAGGRAPDRMDAEERAAYEVTRALLAMHTLDDEQYGRAVAVLGEDRLLELVMLVGYYEMLATQLAVFDVRPPG